MMIHYIEYDEEKKMKNVNNVPAAMKRGGAEVMGGGVLYAVKIPVIYFDGFRNQSCVDHILHLLQ